MNTPGNEPDLTPCKLPSFIPHRFDLISRPRRTSGPHPKSDGANKLSSIGSGCVNMCDGSRFLEKILARKRAQFVTDRVTASLLSTATAVSTSVASGFVASDKSVTFALNIPQNETNNNLYFTLQGPSSSSWIVWQASLPSNTTDELQAVGMGNDKMDDTLMFMAYADSTGNNITLSARLSYAHVEPSYDSNVSFSLQYGSGIINGNYVVNAICYNCRSWKGGLIDPTNTAAKFIFASGPDGSLNSNSLSADIKRHSSYGSFTMDLTKAVGTAGVPVAFTADTSGTVQT